jgi:hypothetical protein
MRRWIQASQSQIIMVNMCAKLREMDDKALAVMVELV